LTELNELRKIEGDADLLEHGQLSADAFDAAYGLRAQRMEDQERYGIPEIEEGDE